MPKTTAAETASTERKTDQQQSSGPSRLTALAGNALLDQWFLIALLLLVLFSSQVQVPTSGQDLKNGAVNTVTIAVIFFTNGCTIPTKVLVSSLKAWRCHLFTQAMSFFVTSGTTLGVVAALATNERLLDPALLNGLVVLGCLPTAFSFTTVMTGKANGNTALSLTQSVIGNILGPVISTSLIQLYSSRDVWYTRMLAMSSNVEYGDLFRKIFTQFGFTLFLPLSILWCAPGMTGKLMNDWGLRKLASFALLALIWSAYDSAFANGSFATISAGSIAFVAFLSAGLFVAWMVAAIAGSIAWLGREDVVAAAFCVPAKSPALGVPLIAIMFVGIPNADMAKMYLPMVFYQCIQVSMSSLATIPLRKWQTIASKQFEQKCFSDTERGKEVLSESTAE